jgi:tetratricopeptide (TPR) repeat protein
MKSKYVLLASALLISVTTFAQKDQIKAAEKLVKAGNENEALSILKEAEVLSATAPDAEKAQFQFVKANAHLALATKNENTDVNLTDAAKAYQEVLSIEKVSGKAKFSAQASTSIIDVKYKLINAAIADSKAEKHAAGAKKLYDAYLLDKKDTINLYYAASTYVNAKEYEAAYNAYDELKKLNYSGKGINYYAVNKITGEEDLFANVNERDQRVKLGTHEKPRAEKLLSKRGEIFKNMALILVQNGKVAEAKKAVAEARIANPEDKTLILTEANLYLDTKDYDTYKKLITEVLEQSPNDADLVFNLGVISYNAKKAAETSADEALASSSKATKSGKVEESKSFANKAKELIVLSQSSELEAEKYYKKAIEIKPDYVNAYLNLAILKLDADKKLFYEIQKLGNSEKDNKRYEVLKKQREAVFASALPYLEKASELDGTNEEVKGTLLSVYRALEMTEKVKALKAKMKK